MRRGGRQTAGHTRALLRVGHDLHEMSVRIREVQAAPASARIDLTVRRIARPAAIGDVFGFETAEDLVELLVTDEERVVMRIEGVAGAPVETQVVVDVYLSKGRIGLDTAQPKDPREKPGRALLVARWHDGVIQNDRHGNGAPAMVDRSELIVAHAVTRWIRFSRAWPRSLAAVFR